MTIKIDKFGGIAPRQHPTLLADGMATTAMNVKLDSGKLVPLREPSEVDDVRIFFENGLTAIKDAKTLLLWRKAEAGGFEMLAFPGMVWAAPGNVADDNLTRLVVSGYTGVKFNSWSNSPALYLRENGQKKVVSLCKSRMSRPYVMRASGSPSLSSGIVRYTRFFYSWVDAYGMESPISSPSVVVTSFDGSSLNPQDKDLEYLDGDTIMFRALNPPSGAKKIRVYKVITGASEGRVQMVFETSDMGVVTSSGGFSVTVKDENAAEVAPEIESPPGNLRCIQNVPGSYYCGFSPSYPKTVMFSDVDLLYSWPTQYRYDIADNIVALAVTSNTVFALTDGWPYALSGTAPESMSVAKLASPAACVSPRGVCVFKNTVFYASNAGLMALANSATEGTVVQNVTEQMFTKDQWKALAPETCLLGHHQGRLYAYFTPSESNPVGLTFNFSEGLSVALTQHNEVARCLCVDDAEDDMYFIREKVD